MAGFCDVEQRLCLGLALWNGRDPILKERMFGLTGAQGNHGEDVKEYWWYLDAVPSHAWNRWRYHYPQRRFPYDELIAENGRRGKFDPEYELLDTGVFDDDRYWIVEVDYAKADPDDLLMTVRVTNAGPDAETLHVLPTVWFRNTWSWDVGAEPRRRRRRRRRHRHRPPVPRRPRAAGRPAPDGAAARPPCSATTRPTTAACSAQRPHAVPEGRDQRPRRHGATTVNPDARAPRRRSGTALASSPARRSSCGCACARAARSRPGDEGPRARLRPKLNERRRQRGRRVLRRAGHGRRLDAGRPS